MKNDAWIGVGIIFAAVTKMAFYVVVLYYGIRLAEKVLAG